MNTALTSTGSYAQRVRAELADLPADEVEELTEGLEADLAESWAENNGLPTIDPVSYAEELRRAAGLPAPGEQRQPGLFARLNERRERLVSSVSESPAGASTVEFLVSLQPAWWVARGYLAWALFEWTLLGIPGLVPSGVFSLLVFGTFIVGSVWTGRHQWGRFMNALVIAGNILAVIVLLSLLSAATDRINRPTYDVYFDDESRGGLFLNEDEVTNIFAYGPDGALLDGVQLFTSDGRPIITSFPGGNGCLNWWSDHDLNSMYELDRDPHADDCRTPGA